MNHSIFHEWQEQLRRMRMEESEDGGDSIQDSQAHSSFQQTPHASDQSPYLSDEEFARVMALPSQHFHPSIRPVIHGQRPSHYSCPANVGSITPTVQSAQVTGPEVEVPVPNAKGKKRAAKKTTKKAAKKSKKVVELNDDDAEGESDDGSGSSRWTDPEVQQLIAFRSEMDEEFARNAKKQGVSTWDKLQARMVIACSNFSKSPEACCKKWKAIYQQYNADKRLLQISGEGRKITCKFFEDIDQGFNNRAHVKKLTHGDAQGTPNPAPIDLNATDSGQGSGGSDQVTVNNPGENSNDLSPQCSKAPKKSSAEIYTTAITDMVSHTSQIAMQITETTQVMKDLRMDMLKLIDKL